MAHKDGELFQARDGKWHYGMNGRASGLGYGTKPEAARAYVNAYINVHPKYKPLLAGKTWREVFAMLQMKS